MPFAASSDSSCLTIRSMREPRMLRPSSEMRRPNSALRSASQELDGSTSVHSGKRRTDLDEMKMASLVSDAIFTKCVPAHATRVSGSVSGSGAGPHTYAVKRGAGSEREPREITIPTGSSSFGVRADIFMEPRLYYIEVSCSVL